MEKKAITLRTTINATIQKVWSYFTQPAYIQQWNFASTEWHCPMATNDLRKGGSFSYTMAAKDGTKSFDFKGIYDEVKTNKYLIYTLEDGRKVEVTFLANGEQTEMIEIFEAEISNDLEMQRAAWQAILNNFKALAEAK